MGADELAVKVAETLGMLLLERDESSIKIKKAMGDEQRSESAKRREEDEKEKKLKEQTKFLELVLLHALSTKIK